jgi:hypothetical protein
LKLFLEGHRFTTINCDGTFEVDLKKIDLNACIQGEIGRACTSFGLAYSSARPLLTEKLRCRRIHTMAK